MLLSYFGIDLAAVNKYEYVCLPVVCLLGPCIIHSSYGQDIYLKRFGLGFPNLVCTLPWKEEGAYLL